MIRASKFLMVLKGFTRRSRRMSRKSRRDGDFSGMSAMASSRAQRHTRHKSNQFLRAISLFHSYFIAIS